MMTNMLKGIPFGLAFSVPLILSSRKVSYKDQGTFSFSLWPYSIRLFWAPVVDSLFFRRIGRRKTWVVSCFFFVGVIMISVAEYVHKTLQPDHVKASKGFRFIFFLSIFSKAICNSF